MGAHFYPCCYSSKVSHHVRGHIICLASASAWGKYYNTQVHPHWQQSKCLMMLMSPVPFQLIYLGISNNVIDPLNGDRNLYMIGKKFIATDMKDWEPTSFTYSVCLVAAYKEMSFLANSMIMFLCLHHYVIRIMDIIQPPFKTRSAFTPQFRPPKITPIHRWKSQ